LPTGDVVVAAPGARFDLRSSDAASRRIALHGGSMVFDVVRLQAGERFEVTTPHGAVRVRGTVFAVQVQSDRTVVRLAHGAVEVESDHRRWRLEPGDVLTIPDSMQAPPLPALLVDALTSFHARRASADPESDRPASTDRAAAPDSISDPVEAVAHAPTSPDSEGDIRGLEPRLSSEARLGGGSDETVSTARARSWILQGAAPRALALARSTLRSTHDLGAWRMVEGDALRALGQLRMAANTYMQAALELDGQEAAQAGYLAARLCAQLGDPARALELLDLSLADAPTSSLAERALALRIHCLDQLARTDDLSRAQSDYRRRFGHAHTRAE
jgi:hypothetical protein